MLVLGTTNAVMPFGPGEVRAQIRGADEGGAAGWMLWNPKNDYTGAALRPKNTALTKSSQ